MSLKTIKINEKSHEKLKFISKCLNKKIGAFLGEFIDNLFEILSVYGNANITYELRTNSLTLFIYGRKNIFFAVGENEEELRRQALEYLERKKDE